MDLGKYMRMAIEKATLSLREGNNGFGAVVVKGDQVISAAHDREETESDPTSHAEINAIRAAAKKLGKNLAGCVLVATHEPCPMCATAIVWSGLSEIAYGYSIAEAVKQGRKRIELSCAELFDRAGAKIKIHENILHQECSVLYRQDVREEIKKLRNADEKALSKLNAESADKRVNWYEENCKRFEFMGEDPLDSGYKLLLARFKTTECEMPVIEKNSRRILFHSQNFCPTLEACKLLGLDTRIICKKLNESSTDTLIKQIDSRLRFSRNYDKLRPYASYCEEMISIEE